jgi:hypothetical protein
LKNEDSDEKSDSGDTAREDATKHTAFFQRPDRDRPDTNRDAGVDLFNFARMAANWRAIRE